MLRHQLAMLERQLGEQVPVPAQDRILPDQQPEPAEDVRRESVQQSGQERPVARAEPRPGLARRHAARSRPKRPGRPRTVRSIRLLVLHLARENPS